MQRVAFTMQLHPGQAEEYKRRHNEIWPELATLLAEAGIRRYGIFLDPDTHTLFAVHEVTDDNTVDHLPEHEVMQRWWRHMADIMETHPDSSPVTRPLCQVFHFDGEGGGGGGPED